MNFSSIIKTGLNAKLMRVVALCIGLVIASLSHQALANYNFSYTGAATTAPNCSGAAGGVYTCTAGLNNAGQFMSIDNSGGPVIINITGAMNVYEQIQIVSSNNAVVFNVNGALDFGGYTIGNAAAASKTAFFVTGNVTMTFSSINADIYATGSNNISVGTTGAGPYVNGVVETNQGVITVYGTVQGCVKSNTGNANSIILGNGSSNPIAGVRCGGTSGTSCVTNNSGKAMPGICSAPSLIAQYHLDEATWNGTLNETKDTAGYPGGPYDGQAVGTPLPTPTFNNPVKAGLNGTCGYAYFANQTYAGVFTLDGLPVSLAAGDKTTVSFWMYWNGQDSMPIGWNTYDLWIAGGNFGFNTNNYDIYGISSAGLANAWHHVTAVFVNGNASLSKLYIDGALQSLTQLAGTINNTNAYVQSTLQVSGYQAGGFWQFFGGYIDEVRVYNGEVTQAQVTADYQAVHTCPTVGTQASSFNCTIVGGVSNTGHLYTQVAGTAFSVDVVALKSTGATETNYVQSGTKNVTLEFVDGSGSTACASRATLSPAISQAVSFAVSDAGRKTISGINISKAYRDLRCRVTDANQTPNVVGCSSDDFAVRPTSLSVTSSNANADSTGTNANTATNTTIKTGANFSLTATADVAGYDGTPAIDASKLSAHTGAIQAGTVSGSFGAANISTSVATGAGFNYSEVGYFRFGANGVYDSNFTSVDSGNGDCNSGFSASGSLNACSFGNTAATSYFGRFIPDHFAVAPTSVTPACSNLFTYFGQDGLSTAFTLTAQNSANATTQNYTGSFAKLGLTTWANYNFSAATLPASSALSASATAPTGSWTNGSASVVAKHLVSRPASATATTGIVISAAPVDSDSVTMPTTAVSASSNFRYGRLYMPNTYGSELLPLSVPIEAQYWNGSAYQRNQQDSCTTVPVASIAMGNYKNNLAACESAISGAGLMSAGKTTATLSKPGTGNNGSVDLTVNLSTASGSTCTPTSTTASSAGLPWFGTTNPSSRATFGLFKTPVIYMRENF